jgi:hypothetical protein
MSGQWSVMPGTGGAAGVGPVAGTISAFQIRRPDGVPLTAVFAGGGLTAGGPASFTYSDKNTTGFAGNLFWAAGTKPNEVLLKHPETGFILSIGTAPRQFLNYFGFYQGATEVSGLYVSILAFGVTSPPVLGLVPDSAAALSIMADIRFGTRGKLLAGVRAYSAVASLAKGVDVGGVSAIPGRWCYF